MSVNLFTILFRTMYLMFLEILSVMSANHIRNKHEDQAPCLLPTCVVSFIVTMESFATH